MFVLEPNILQRFARACGALLRNIMDNGLIAEIISEQTSGTWRLRPIFRLKKLLDWRAADVNTLVQVHLSALSPAFAVGYIHSATVAYLWVSTSGGSTKLGEAFPMQIFKTLPVSQGGWWWWYGCTISARLHCASCSIVDIVRCAAL